MILFELIFFGATLLISVPFLSVLLDLSFDLAGINYLTTSNLAKFFRSPSAYVSIALLLLLFALWLWFNVSACVYGFLCVREGKSPLLRDMIHEGADACRLVIKKPDLRVIVYGIVCLPFVAFISATGIVVALGIPAFDISLAAFLEAYMLYGAVSLFFLDLWIYLPQASLAHKLNIKSSMRLSRSLCRGKRNKRAFQLIVWLALVFSAIILLSALVTALPCFVISSFSEGRSLAVKISLTALKLLFKALAAFAGIISVPVLVCCQTVMFFEDGSSLPLPEIKIRREGKNNKKRGRIMGIIVLFAVISAYILTSFSGYSLGRVNFGLFATPEISAHRGYSSVAPENTRPAFEAAIESGVEYIELDIQETEDEEIVVMHDSNLKRTTGIKKDVWNCKLDYLRSLDAGSWFSPEFKGEGIMTLAEVLELCQGKIKLNIEIKPTGHEKSIVSKTAWLIRKYGFEESCYVSSFSYEVLKGIKTADPEIKTAYTMGSVFGNIRGLKYADALSVRKNFVTRRFVGMCHGSGKKVFAWTVNRKSEMQMMTEYGVDNIITDDPNKALAVSGQVYTGNSFFSVYRYLSR